MVDIFISYAGEDRSRVEPLADALADHGWSVWWDREIRAGNLFDEVIANALGSARCVVVAWSRISVASSWVRDEAEEGRKRGVLIPVLLDQVSPPLGFGRIQAASLTAWDGNPESKTFRKLVADVTGLIGAPSRGLAVPEPMAPPDRPGASPPIVPRPEIGARTRSALKLSVAVALALALVLAAVFYPRGGRSANTETPAAAATTGLRVSAVLADGGEPLETGVAFTVFEAAQDAQGHRKYITTSSRQYSSAWFQLPPGRYYVTATYENAAASANVEVTPAGPTRQILNLRAGVLRLTAVLTDGAETVPGVAYTVYAAAQDINDRRNRVTGSNHPNESSARFLIPAGRYFVTAAYGNASTSVEVEVKPGETTRQLVNLRAGILRLNAVRSGRGEPLSGPVAYEIYRAARDLEGNRKRVTGSNQPSGPARFVLPAERYVVTAAHSSGNATAETTIAAGRTHDVQLRIVPVTK